MKARLDHEKLDVYQLELQFVAWSAGLVRQLSNGDGVGLRNVADHLNRAALSALPNTAEGNGKRQRSTRAKFFDIARGSAAECAACLDALVAKGACTEERVETGKAMLCRVVSMLTRLVQRCSATGRVGEDEPVYFVDDGGAVVREGETDEDEDDDEDDEDDHA